MKVSDFFRQLSLGELSNLSVADKGTGTIIPEEHAKLILYTNEGLLRLYTRFVIEKKSLILVQVGHITTYHLKRKYAEATGSNVPYKYIKDLQAEPFEEDVIKILEVYDSVGRPRPLNDIEDPLSMFTPQYDQLQIPTPVAGQALNIIYQSRHHKLKDTDNILNQDIDLPFSLEGALQAYVSYKIFDHMNSQENKLVGQSHLANYESICVELQTEDLLNSSHNTSHQKLEIRGFV